MFIPKEKINSFKDLIVWKKFKELSLLVYEKFNNCHDYKFKDQIQTAGILISNNVAEGYGRVGDKELVRFLYIAQGSCFEVRSMLDLAQSLKYISSPDYRALDELAVDVTKLLGAFINRANSDQRIVKGGL